MTHKIYVPIVYGGGKIHSFQIGWDNEPERVFEYEELLGLNNGFDAHLIHDNYPIITVQILEWLEWYNLTYGEGRGYMPISPLAYSKAISDFPFEAEAIAWIQAHPGKTYIIGNEPDTDLSEGNETNMMSVLEYVDFYHKASRMIRNADPTAKLIMGAWAGGVGEYVLPAHNEQEVLTLYMCRYAGIPDIDGFSFHVYQRDNPDGRYPLDKLNQFTSYVNDWYRFGWTLADNILLTEFGWYGLDPVGTPDNCMKFLDWYVPVLKAHPQVRAYYWWEWADGSMLVRDGQATELGLYYAEMRK